MFDVVVTLGDTSKLRDQKGFNVVVLLGRMSK